MPGFFSSVLRSINRKDTEQLHSDMRAQRATAAILKCSNGEEQKCSVLSQAASLVDFETCFVVVVLNNQCELEGHLPPFPTLIC